RHAQRRAFLFARLPQPAHVLAAQVLRAHVVDARDLVELEDLADVGVDELGGDPRLILEHGDELLVLAEMGVEGLDHQQLGKAVNSAVSGEIDLAHTAAGESLQELIPSEGGMHGRLSTSYANTRRRRARTIQVD